jgi:hypothetical protein
MRNSAEVLYGAMHYMCFCICVDLKDLDGGSEFRMGSDILFCVF